MQNRASYFSHDSIRNPRDKNILDDIPRVKDSIIFQEMILTGVLQSDRFYQKYADYHIFYLTVILLSAFNE